eukprot:COSAG01_NODE_9758_length_2352_cov_1.598757_4_plen_76_part_00
MLSGRKRWRMVGRGDLTRCYGAAAGPSATEGGVSLGGEMIDLFDDAAAAVRRLCVRFCRAAAAVAWESVLRLCLA